MGEFRGLDTEKFNPIILFANLSYLQSWIPNSSVYFSFNAPSWSLSNEVFFYLCFFFLAAIPFRKLLNIAIGLFTLLIISASAVTIFFDGDKLTTFWYKMHNNKHEHTYVFTNAREFVYYNEQTRVMHNTDSINSQLNNLKNHNHDEAKIWFLSEITRIQTYKQYYEWCKVVKVDVKPESEFNKYVKVIQVTKVPILIKK